MNRLQLMRARLLAPPPLSSDHRQILRYIELHGALLGVEAERQGWTLRGVPQAPLRDLVEFGIVAPRALTGYPVSISWELREKARSQATHTRIEREARRVGVKEADGSDLNFATRDLVSPRRS